MDNRSINCLLGIVLLSLAIQSCENTIENDPQAICVTAEATGITETGAILNGYANLTIDMTGAVELGFIISEQPTPSLSNGRKETTRELDPSNKFSKAIKRLSPNTKYYYRAYVLRNNVYIYGEIMSFSTRDFSMAVTTGDVQSLTETSAILNGELLFDSIGIVV